MSIEVAAAAATSLAWSDGIAATTSRPGVPVPMPESGDAGMATTGTSSTNRVGVRRPSGSATTRLIRSPTRNRSTVAASVILSGTAVVPG